MERVHPLKNLQQSYVSSDLSAVLHLPFILSCLTSEVFSPSPHLTKWTTRVNALIHSKDSGARWAGLCIALRMASLSKDVMLECAQGWTTIVLPFLSRNEHLSIWKAAIRLLAFVFSTTMGVPEFQRQVVTPNIPKYSLALVTLVQKQNDEELKLLATDTLSILIPLHPSCHRALLPSITAVTLQMLDGSSVAPTPIPLIKSAARLYAALPITGGKVGSANLWRKGVDETITFCWTSFAALRTTYLYKGHHHIASQSSQDPLETVPLNIDRLRCGIALIETLLRSPTSRPVLVPVASLVDLCVGLLRCIPDEEEPDHVDRIVRATEEAVIPRLLELGCDLIACLAQCIRQRLTPHLSKLLSFVTLHLERQQPIPQRLPFLRTLPILLNSCHPPHNPLLSGRLIKSILPSLSVLLSKDSDVRRERAQADAKDASTGRKDKKRARAYEGDEVFNIGKEVICSTSQEGEIILAALDALLYLLRTPNLAQYLQSVTMRVLLSLLLNLPQMSASSISKDLSLGQRIFQKVKNICVELSVGTSAVMSKSLALVTEPVMDITQNGLLFPSETSHNQRLMDVLLHPRLPPILRPLHSLDSIALARADESTEEKNLREVLGLANVEMVSAESTPNAPSSKAPLTSSDGAQTPHQNASARFQPVVTLDAPHSPRSPKAVHSTTPSTNPPLQVAPRPDPQSTIPPPLNPSVLFTSELIGKGSVKSPSPSQQMPSATSKTFEVSVDTPMDDDDEEMPTINMESDTESE